MLCTNEALINCFEILSGLGKSDHLCVNLCLNIFDHNQPHQSSFDKHKNYNWNKISYNEILQFSNNISWAYSSNDLTVQNMWNEIHRKLMQLTDKVPLNVGCNNKVGKDINMPWVTSALKRCRKMKEKMWAVFDMNPTPLNLNVALAKQNDFENKELSAKIKYERRITKDLKSCSKPFYSYLRNRIKVKSIVTSLKKGDGSLTKNDKETADIFATLLVQFLSKSHLAHYLNFVMNTLI